MIAPVVRTVHDLVSRYAAAKLRASAASVARMRGDASAFASWAGDDTLNAFCDDAVCLYLKSRIEAGDSASTVNTRRARLLALWRFAAKRRLVDEAPGDIERVPEPHDPPVARDVSDLQRLLNYCSTLRGTVGGIPQSLGWASLFLAAYDTAERPSALIQTRCCDFDSATATLRVFSGTTKTKRGRLYRLRPQTAAAVRAIWSPSRELLWDWPHCKRYFFTRARRIMESAGLECRKDRKDLFYSIKRTSLSYTAASDLELARRQAGHTSSATTLRHYVDPRVAESRCAADVLPDLSMPPASTERQLLLF